jgi:hypothetical protein
MRRSIVLAISPFIFAAGCLGHADIMIDNPIASGQLQQPNEIIKPAPYAEAHHQLPPMSMDSKARILEMNGQRACFEVMLHSLQPGFDLRTLKQVLKGNPGDKFEGATVWPNPPQMRTYQGMVDERVPAGSETYCASRDAATNVCLSWQTRPIYRYIQVPGPVNVYESTGKLCFDHRGAVNAQSERMILDLFWIEMVGFMPNKHAIAFRWGFFPPAGKK